jgi:hypothetical protein
MPDHPVENLGNLNVRVVIHRDNLDARPILALIVGDLMYVLRQLVNRQAWPCVNRLTLHRTTGRQHICGPLPLVIRATRVEPQII